MLMRFIQDSYVYALIKNPYFDILLALILVYVTIKYDDPLSKYLRIPDKYIIYFGYIAITLLVLVFPLLLSYNYVKNGPVVNVFLPFLGVIYVSILIINFIDIGSHAIYIYPVNRNSLVFKILFGFRFKQENAFPSKARLFFSSLYSYFFTIYIFSLYYWYISLLDKQSFNVGAMDLFTAMYFSVVTIATVGYGDILPLSNLARLLVILEVIFGFLYLVFFISIVSTMVSIDKQAEDKSSYNEKK